MATTFQMDNAMHLENRPNPEYSQEQLEAILKEAAEAAMVAANKFYQEQLEGQDRYACGFAWVEFDGIKGNTKLGRMLKKAGVRQNWERQFEIWNPSGHMCQNVDTKEAGAYAAAEVLKKYGFNAYARSRLD